MDEWLKWVAKNPELAEKKYPILVTGLKNRIKEEPAFVTANIIQNLPKNFDIWKSETDMLSGKTKLKEIDEHIKLLEGILYD